MTIADLSIVTRTLLEMIDQRFQNTNISTVTMSALPPDVLTEKASGEYLGLYLYHATEEPYFKSQAPNGSGNPPIQFTPMVLNLHYQMTVFVKRTNDNDEGVFLEQTYMGVAMKAMHDFSMMNENTIVRGPDPVFKRWGLDGKETHLRVSLLPITHTESLQFWNTSSKHPRLSAYYQVSVVMLDPERLKSRAGRVLRYGIQTFVGHGPHLERSSSTIEWIDPDNTKAHALAQPAIAIVGDPKSLATFFGWGFVGDGVFLQLRSPRFAEQTKGDRDVVEDASWAITNTDTTVTVNVGNTASGLFVVPGMYSARIRVRQTKQTPSGPRAFDLVSNETPFIVAPRIDTITSVGTLYTLTGGMFAWPRDKRPTSDPTIDVLVDGVALEVVRPDADLTKPIPVPGKGQFVPEPDKITFALASKPTNPVSIRVIVDGAESAPRWFS